MVLRRQVFITFLHEYMKGSVYIYISLTLIKASRFNKSEEDTEINSNVKSELLYESET